MLKFRWWQRIKWWNEHDIRGSLLHHGGILELSNIIISVEYVRTCRIQAAHPDLVRDFDPAAVAAEEERTCMTKQHTLRRSKAYVY